jgi:phage baseplate assembly protein W
MNQRQRFFGNDLRLVERASGLDVARGAGGDLALAEGNENIVQALALRLRVRQGELAGLGWPNFGSRLHELIGEPNTPRTRVKIMAFARGAIEQDPRVAEITNIQTRVLPGERDTVQLLMDVRLISEATPLNLVFDVNLGTS